MAGASVDALFQALQVLTEQVKQLTMVKSGGKPWDSTDKYKNIKMFAGDQREYEEFATKLRSQVAASNGKVAMLMKTVENDCSEELLAKGKFDECRPTFDNNDAQFIMDSSNEMYNLLLNMTTGEANAMVRRCNGQGWLAWKKITSSLNPRTLASGIKAISAVLSPGKMIAAKADVEIETWEDRMAKLSTEYGQEVSGKMKVAVLYSMLPKDLQEKVLDECAINWDATKESQANELFVKLKTSIKNIAKSRREAQGPKPMEVDRVSGAWADWSEDDWGDGAATNLDHSAGDGEQSGEEAYVQYIGKGGGKKGGKGFQGHCFKCGEFGHSQWDCGKGAATIDKGKGKGKDHYMKGYGKDWYSKGYGKDWYSKGYGKGKGGDYGKGATMVRACFGCGATDHIVKDCQKNAAKVQQVGEEAPEIFFVANVQGDESEKDWKRVPMKVKLSDFIRVPVAKGNKVKTARNAFKVLEVDEEDAEEVVEVRAIEKVLCKKAYDKGVCNKNDCGIGHECGKGKDFIAIPKTPAYSYDGPVFGGLRGSVRGWEDELGGPGFSGGPGFERALDFYSNPKEKAKQFGDPKSYPVEWYNEKRDEEVHFVRAVGKDEGWLNFGKGDIVVDSAADESCWPAGQGDAFPTKESARKMLLRTADGGEMTHYGQKEISFMYEGGKDVMGLVFQVTDVKKLLLAVRRLVEKGNRVVLSAGDGESYIQNVSSKIKIPIVKKGGSFVIEANFVKKAVDFARRA